MSQFFSTKYKQGALDFSLFFLRLAGGGLMILHGFNKLIHFTDKVKKFPDPIHIGSTLSLSLVIFAEFFCAVLLVFGLLTRLAAIPLVIVMSVALFVVHGGRVFDDGESAALFLAVFTCLLFIDFANYSWTNLVYALAFTNHNSFSPKRRKDAAHLIFANGNFRHLVEVSANCGQRKTGRLVAMPSV